MDLRQLYSRIISTCFQPVRLSIYINPVALDIGANLLDPMYQGIYNGNKKHESDLNNVLCRSWNAGLEKIIITGTSLDESIAAIDVAKADDRLYCSVGCHPTNCTQIFNYESPATYFTKLRSVVEGNLNKVVAIGELGLDYERLHFCSREIQMQGFKEQLKCFSGVNLPLFLHCRSAAADLHQILIEHQDCWKAGVVHSFTGTLQEAEMFMNLGLYIGINGCSLKTKENIEVVMQIPTEKILLETDSPWCEIRPTHAGSSYIQTKFIANKKEKWEADKMVKGRNEPCTMRQVLEVVAGIKEIEPLILAEEVLHNTRRLFFP